MSCILLLTFITWQKDVWPDDDAQNYNENEIIQLVQIAHLGENTNTWNFWITEELWPLPKPKPILPIKTFNQYVQLTYSTNINRD